LVMERQLHMLDMFQHLLRLNDYNATLGFKSSKNGWTSDASVTMVVTHKFIR
jgi:hypothetical protein